MKTGYKSTYTELIRIVEFKDGRFNPVDDVDGFDYEIIGNIYEKEDLIK